MSGSRPEAIAYLVPRRESFWRWSAGTHGVEWRDGRTIAFPQELVAVLAHLAPGGLPPLGAVLMLLAACRDNWGAAANAARILSAYSGAFESDLAGVPRPGLVIAAVVPAAVRMDLAAVVEDLDRVAALPAELRTSVRAKCVLAETVFEGARRAISPERADAVVRALSEGFDPEPLLDVTATDDAFRQLDAELEALRAGLAKVDAERLRLRSRTGLDEAVGPAPVELPDAVRVRNLLARLRDDPELAGVTQVARNLLAAIHVPRALAAPQELPVGGVSDLSNRGELDRLLVSELAHDDLTLTTRIALNEALYLRREAPRSAPPRDRIILIDTGIRLWGVPRVFATGVALALAASSEKGARVRAFRPAGRGVESADLTTREGLVAQLEAIDASPDPGEALRAVAGALPPGRDGADVMLVTHEDVLADPDFARVLREVDGERDWHVATVNGGGGFRLQQVGRAGRRTLCAAQLSLDELLAGGDGRRPKPTALVDPRVDPSLPVIFSTEPFPLLLPARADARRAVVSTKFGLLSVTHDGRLMRWTSERQGGVQLAAGTPPGVAMGLFADEEAEVIYYVSHDTPAGRPARTHVLLCNPDGRQRRLPNVEAGEPLRAAAHHGGVLLLLYDRRVIAIDAEGEVVADRGPLPDCRWHSGRFYLCGETWSAAHFDGRDIDFAHVTARDSLAIFDREGHGPWQLLRAGHVAAVIGPPLVAHKPAGYRPPARYRFSQDGHRILGYGWHGRADWPEGYLLDLTVPLAWRPVGLEGHALLVGEELDWSAKCGVNVYNRFDAIYARFAGGVGLVRGDRHLAIEPGVLGKSGLVPMDSKDRDPSAGSVARFGRGWRPRGARFKLRTATWPDGSRAFLDSRGLLHLKSADRTIPEITLVLTDRTLAGWTSDGHTFGWAFFHRQPPTQDAEYVYALLKVFSTRLR